MAQPFRFAHPLLGCGRSVHCIPMREPLLQSVATTVLKRVQRSTGPQICLKLSESGVCCSHRLAVTNITLRLTESIFP